MTCAVFKRCSDSLCGFTVSGHTDSSGTEQAKLVCAAVSSAVYMAANTITDVIGDKADISVNDAEFKLMLKNPSERSVAVLEGLQLHLTELKNQYKQYIVINTEVQHDA